METLNKAEETTAFNQTENPIYFTVNGNKNRLAFSVLQWEKQQQLTKLYPGTVGTLASMVYSAIERAYIQDTITQPQPAPFTLRFDVVENEVDKLITDNQDALQEIIEYRNRVSFYKEAAQQLNNLSEGAFIANPSPLAEM